MKDFKTKYLKKCFIIAEISANHGQSYKRAVSLIRKAKECGASAVKFQAYTPDSLTIDSSGRYFTVSHPEWGGQTLYELYKKAYTPLSWFRGLKKIADDLGLLFFATAFDKDSVDTLEDINVAVHKIASFELVDIPLIEYAAKTKKPLILSTGMATMQEIKEAILSAKGAGSKDIVLLKCTSSYPAGPKHMNLRTIAHMHKIFKCPVGLSDHTLGQAVPLAAVALGAKVIEKHFTLSRKLRGPDSFFSIEPDELRSLVENIRMVEDSLGKVHYGLTAQEYKSRNFRRSLFVVKDIKKGEKISVLNVRSIRPAYGIKPKYSKNVLGKIVRRDIAKGTPLKFNLIK